jgi:hypothetical protein
MKDIFTALLSSLLFVACNQSSTTKGAANDSTDHADHKTSAIACPPGSSKLGGVGNAAQLAKGLKAALNIRQ